ncbi:MAG: RNA ligase family protein [Patescibacteria group bacterium]
MIFPEFHSFKKIPRLTRDIYITEKLDGSSGIVYIDYDLNIFAGSRNRWLWGSIQDEIHNDNHSFAQWVKTNKEELLGLGVGFHFGEFWGKKINRGYGLNEKRFSLFDVNKWVKDETKKQYLPSCCSVVPLLYEGPFDTSIINYWLDRLAYIGSYASPGYMDPEGICVYHTAGDLYFKKTIKHDEQPKGVTNENK